MGYLKLGGGLLALLALAALVGWGKIGWNHYHSEQAKLHGLVSVIGQVTSNPKLKVKDSPKAVRELGAERDDFRKRWIGARDALADQTDRVLALNAETVKLREQADRAAAQVAALTRQRDGWIRKAQIASTRKERRSAEAEASECEATMDALREAGF